MMRLEEQGKNMSKASVYIFSGVVLLIIAVIFWPVVHANFVWDDWQSFHDKPWLTQGDLWKHTIFHGFNDWSYYFRPLVVAFFTLQVRLFDSTPGPMHAVSLIIHLLDTTLVGLLSWQCAKLSGAPRENRAWITPLCMALYGLHAALIEPVAWIGCQFDLIATMLMLVGLLANIHIQRRMRRAACLAVIFFLAASAKESAISFPPLLVLFDWVLINSEGKQTPAISLRMLLQRNWPAYVGVLFAGCLYIAFRHWALGNITNGLQPEPLSLSAKLQEICFTYLQYWKIILWPISGLNPIHPIDIQQFNDWPATSWGVTILALGVFFGGLYAGIKHASPVGWIILAVTAALLPVLYIIPGQFERSLYHERYATTALAVACAMLPLLRRPLSFSSKNVKSIISLAAISITCLWLAFCIVSIRLTLPLWSNDVNLWHWALSKHPQSPQAKNALLLTYVRNKDFHAAMELADSLLDDTIPCFECTRSIAELALANNDLPRATLALKRMKDSPLLKKDRAAVQIYYLFTARLLLQEGKLNAAEEITRNAIAVDPKNPKPHNLLVEIAELKKRPIPSH